MTETIARIDAPCLTELRRTYLEQNLPVILTDQTDHWPATSKWTPQYLAEMVGHKTVPVVTMVDGDYARSRRTDMLMSEYLDIVEAQERAVAKSAELPRETHYLAQAPIAKVFPQLMDDIEIPPFFSNETYSSAVMYAGGTLFSQLHYHPRGSALLCMLYGQKKVRLFPPDQSRYLYPHGVHTGLAHVSRTRHKHPDPAVYPEFENARYIEVTLRAGDSLFIPIYWWHSIENIGISISSVFFWSTSWWSRFLPPPGPRASYLYQPVAEVTSLTRRVIGRITRVFQSE